MTIEKGKIHQESIAGFKPKTHHLAVLEANLFKGCVGYVCITQITVRKGTFHKVLSV
jgi:hypothetical protein